MQFGLQLSGAGHTTNPATSPASQIPSKTPNIFAPNSSSLRFLNSSYSQISSLKFAAKKMNSREVTLISTSAIISSIASIIAFRFFFNNSSKSHPKSSKSPPIRSPFDPSKRKGYLSWDDYFMAIAFLSAERSKDPNRQVGACLVSEDGIILGIGYNGFPRGCSDDKLPWAKKSKTGNSLETKYPYVCHAEVNAILNTNHASAAGQRLYVTMFPCNECAKIIIQSGVSEVIFFVEKKLGNSEAMYAASHKLLSLAGVKVRKHQPKMTQILLKFEDP